MKHLLGSIHSKVNLKAVAKRKKRGGKASNHLWCSLVNLEFRIHLGEGGRIKFTTQRFHNNLRCIWCQRAKAKEAAENETKARVLSIKKEPVESTKVVDTEFKEEGCCPMPDSDPNPAV